VPGRARRALLVALALWATAAFLMTTLARPLWDIVPATQLMQYPFRLRMVTTLAAALLMGGLASLRWRPGGAVLGAAAVGLVAWASLVEWRTPRLELGPSAFEPGAFARYELVPFYPETGTTVPAQFLPSSVALRQDELKQSRLRTAPPQPELEADVRVVGREPTALRLRTDAAAPFRLRYPQFDFPGWRATLDGAAPLALAPDGERGLVSVEVPAGAHELELRWQDDPRWTGAALLSALGLAAAVGLALVPRRRWAGPAGAALTFGLVLSAGALAPRLAGALVPPPAAAALTYPAGLSLTGWSATVGRGAARSPQPPFGDPLPGGEVMNGMAAWLDVDLYWLARRDLTEDHRVELRLLDGAGQERARYHRPPNWGATPTSTWSRGELVHDRHRFPLPSGLRAGSYALEVGLDDGPGRVVGRVDLPVTPDQTSVADESAVHFANGLTLVAWRSEPDGRSDPPTLARGGTLRVWLLWEVRDEVPNDTATSVFLADHNGEKHALSDSYPPHDLEFSASWLKGSRHEQHFDLAIDEGLPAGLYRLSLELYDYASGARVPLQEPGATRAPLRLYKLPGGPSDGRGVRFRDGILLQEHAVRATDDALEVDLRWAASARPGREYTVFLHLYDASGKLVAQQDGPPLGGAYPTRVWDAGEAMAETRRVPLPAGGLPAGAALKVGLYLPSSGERLPTLEGADGVELPLPGR
jgi:hypothetical protein